MTRKLSNPLKAFTSLFLAVLLVGCASSSRETRTSHDERIRNIAVQTFGNDANLKVHQVVYTGPISSALSSVTTSDELALVNDLQVGANQNVDLVVWSYSSSKAASVLQRALRYPGVQRLPHLRLLFVGDPQDAERIRPVVEATGAQFYHRAELD